jgi:hypothetical protein
MLLVIFGAGASFDSCPAYPVSIPRPTRLPLAMDLFANRPLFEQMLDYFPQCQGVVHRLRVTPTGTQRPIETVLQEIVNEGDTYLEAHREVAAIRCYLQRVIFECENAWRLVTHGITNQRALLREIHRTRQTEDVCLVTFNYDTLIEEGLSGIGYNIRQMDAYITQRFKLFKLHGSIDWVQLVSNGVPQNMIANKDGTSVLRFLIDHAEGLKLEQEIRQCVPQTIGIVDGRAAFPAIAIPVEIKNDFVCPLSHVDALQKLVPQISDVLLIGWRATEAHFLKLLKDTLPPFRLYIVAGRQGWAEETQIQFCTAIGNSHPNEIAWDPGGFTDFLTSGRAKAFLEGHFPEGAIRPGTYRSAT